MEACIGSFGCSTYTRPAPPTTTSTGIRVGNFATKVYGGTRPTFVLKVGQNGATGRAITWLALYGPALTCSSWQPSKQRWNYARKKRYLELYPPQVGLLNIPITNGTAYQVAKRTGPAWFAGTRNVYSSIDNRLHVIGLSVKFVSPTRAIGKVSYAIYWSSTPGKTLDDETRFKFNLGRPGNFNVNRCMTPTISFDAYYGAPTELP